jgi:hypothetical protein
MEALRLDERYDVFVGFGLNEIMVSPVPQL